MLAVFVNNNTWFGVLITLHVLGAVIGLGPTFAFGLLGGMAEKMPGPGGLALMEGILKIENSIANPILLTVQPLTGALMIWNRGLNNHFFSVNRLWLIGGIAAYMIAVVIALLIMDPSIHKMITLAKGGQAETPEFGGYAQKVKAFGPILTVLGLVIVVLMIWKPGSHCLYQC
jgi:uncharacterized membrane protein